jgi:hypothetical protein
MEARKAREDMVWKLCRSAARPAIQLPKPRIVGTEYDNELVATKELQSNTESLGKTDERGGFHALAVETGAGNKSFMVG